jgi:hypothetical protein
MWTYNLESDCAIRLKLNCPFRAIPIPFIMIPKALHWAKFRYHFVVKITLKLSILFLKQKSEILR